LVLGFRTAGITLEVRPPHVQPPTKRSAHRHGSHGSWVTVMGHGSHAVDFTKSVQRLYLTALGLGETGTPLAQPLLKFTSDTFQRLYLTALGLGETGTPLAQPLLKFTSDTFSTNAITKRPHRTH